MSNQLIDKALAYIGENIDTSRAETLALRSHAINSSFSVTPRPYDRIAFVMPQFWNVNTLMYHPKYITIGANTTTANLVNMFRYDGTMVTSGNVDVMLVMFRLM